MSKFGDKNYVVAQSVDTVCCTFKVLVPDSLHSRLEELYDQSDKEVKRMLKNRDESSSKYYKSIPCTLAKSLITKYQKNKKIKTVTNLVLPICGDKGTQIKKDGDDLLIPSLFKKEKIPVQFPYPLPLTKITRKNRKTGEVKVVGEKQLVRCVEFFKRDGDWFMSYSYDAATAKPVPIEGCVGVDRNSVGNIATLSDPGNGKVKKMGINPAKTKEVYRGRKKNLQKAGKKRLLKRIKRKQSRRFTYENHKVSKTIVDYAATHRRAIVLEDLSSIRKKGSKAKRYTEKSQWGFYQLAQFIEYKAALRGVAVIYVNPAYTSQDCSRCGSRHKPTGKAYKCRCGLNEHRDANAGFNIALRGYEALSMPVAAPTRIALSGPIGGSQAENQLDQKLTQLELWTNL